MFWEEIKHTVISVPTESTHSTTAGRILVVLKSVKGKGTNTISPFFIAII
jgi:hypothetical protein